MKNDEGYLLDRSAQLLNKAKRDGTIALFYFGGKFRAIGVIGTLYTETFKTKIHRLVGVYNSKAKEEWIFEDMEYMCKLFPDG